MTTIPSVDYLWNDELAPMQPIRIEVTQPPLIKFTNAEIMIFSVLCTLFFGALFAFAIESGMSGYHNMDLRQQEVTHGK